MVSSNVYVSATRGYEPDDQKDKHGYRRMQHTWLISIEPNKHFVPGLPRHKQEPIHYFATEEGDSYNVQSHTTDGIIGTILIGEGAHTNAEKLEEVLAAGLKSTQPTVPPEQTPDSESDRWIRKGLHVLQEHKIIASFNVGEFMTFAHGFIANRLEHEAPAMIAYPGLGKEHAKKTQKHGFWLSYPMKAPSNTDEESRRYGGLM